MNVKIPYWAIIILDIIAAAGLWFLVSKAAFAIYTSIIIISWTYWGLRLKAEKDKFSSQNASKHIFKHDMSE